MKHRNILVIIFLVALVLVAGYFISRDKKSTVLAPEISGHKEDLLSFSIQPGQKVSGAMKITGSLTDNYFFEGNIGVAVLDANKQNIRQTYGTATTDWMTSGPVSFEADLDFTGLPKGPGFIQIQNDNPSDIRANDKFIYIPVVIE